MKKTKYFVAAAALVLTAFAASAQTPAPAPSATHAKARQLLEAMGAGKLGLQMVDRMMGSMKEMAPDAPDAFWTEFRSRIKADEFLDMLTPIYEKHITESDLDALIAFYTSPAGKRYVAAQPQILADSMTAGQEWGGRIAQEALSELEKKGIKPKE